MLGQFTWNAGMGAYTYVVDGVTKRIEDFVGTATTPGQCCVKQGYPMAVYRRYPSMPNNFAYCANQ
jgi:hypothetical protein